MRRLTFSVIGVIAAAAIVIGINMFADARFADIRADLTQGKIYSLSKGTQQILNSLKEPVTLRFFYSRRLGATIPVSTSELRCGTNSSAELVVIRVSRPNENSWPITAACCAISFARPS